MVAVLFIAFLLSSYGAVNIITGSKLFAPLRKRLAQIEGKPGEWLGYWIKCPMCMGVPVGMFWRLIGIFPDISKGLYRELLVAACISSGFCWIVRVVLVYLGEDEL